MRDPMRYCVRCGAEVHMSAQVQPHLCKDVERRLRRRELQVREAAAILREHGIGLNRSMVCAEEIVARLVHMGVEHD